MKAVLIAAQVAAMNQKTFIDDPAISVRAPPSVTSNYKYDYKICPVTTAAIQEKKFVPEKQCIVPGINISKCHLTTNYN